MTLEGRMAIRTKLIRIGNSHGVRLHKSLIEQVGLGSTVEIDVEAGALVIRPVRSVRQGWDEAFQRMAERGDDALVDAEQEGSNDWDQTEWEW
jgi:antitoxin MazE